MSNNIPKVSVLVPVYGVEKYIAKCARALFSQTWQNMEYVFVDDCSPDRSIEVLRQSIAEYPHRESQVRIVRQPQNGGVGYARRRALEECTGEYLVFVDSDDDIPHDSIEKLVNAAIATGADIVDGAYREFTDYGVAGGNAVLPSHLAKERYLKRMLLQNIVKNNLWARIYRRNVYTDHDITFMEGVDYGEDFSIMPRLMLNAKRAFIDDVVYFYRIDNAASYTHRRTPKQNQSLIMANAIVFRHFIGNDMERRYFSHLNMGMVNIYRYARQNGLPQADIDNALGQPLSGFAPRLCRWLFGSSVPFGVSDIIYRILRRLYI